MTTIQSSRPSDFVQVARPVSSMVPTQSPALTVGVAELKYWKSTTLLAGRAPPTAGVTWPVNTTLADVPVPADQNRFPV